MKKSEVQAIRQQLRAQGEDVSDALLEQAERLVKSIQDGTFQMDEEEAVEDAAATVEATAAKEPETSAEKPVVKAVETMTPESVQEALTAKEEVKKAINAVPVLGEMLEVLKGMASSLREMEEVRVKDQSVIKSLSAQVEKLQQAPPAPESRGNAEVAETLAKAVNTDTARAFDAVLQQNGILDRLEKLDEAVNRRPWSGNPPRGRSAQPVRKSLGALDELPKNECIALIQKSMDLKRMSSDEAQEALAQLDIAPRAGISFAEVVRRFDKKTLEEYASE